MKKILVPMDFSEEAMYAMEAAVAIARKSEAEILMPHIIEMPGHFYHDAGKLEGPGSEKIYVKQLMTHFNERMASIKGQANFQNVKIEPRVEIGNAYPSLKKLAIDSKADLVIMGSKGVGELKDIYLGSTSQRMIRNSNCPVLTVKNSLNIDGLKNIVFATNFSRTPFYVTNEIQALTRVLEVNLQILTINTKKEWRTNREIKTEVKAFADQHQIENYEIKIYDDHTAVEGIIHYSEDQNTDMIAVMTHGNTGLPHLLSGSIAEKIAGYSTLPIWTCRVDMWD